MARHPTLPDLGRIVEITKGRDSGMYAVVIGYVGDRFVLLADGDKRKADKPKRKNALHIRSTSQLAHEVVESIRQDGKVTNARIRHAIRQYLREVAGMTDEDEAQTGSDSR